MARKPTKPTESDAIVHQLRNSYQFNFHVHFEAEAKGCARNIGGRTLFQFEAVDRRSILHFVDVELHRVTVPLPGDTHPRC